MSSATTHTPERAGRRAWFGLAALMLPVLLVSVDGTVLTFAVPSITRALRPSGTELLWSLDIYPLVIAGLLVTAGTLGDRYGRRKLLLLGATGFAAASALAAYSPDMRWLIAARALQAVFGAALMPATLSLLRNLFLDAMQRRLAVAIWGAGFAGGAALGPIVGGWLLEHFWWGSIFLINVPVLAVLLLATPLLPESRDPHPGPLDGLSVALSLTTMLPIVFAIKGLTGGSAVGPTLAILAVGLISGGVFIRRQLTRPAPLLDLGLFRSRVVTAAMTTNLVSIAMLSGLILFASQYMQLMLGLRPRDAALLMIPALLAAVLAGLAAVPLTRILTPRVLVIAGLLLSAAGYLLANRLELGTGVTPIVIAFVFVAAGAGLAETLTNDAILTAAPAERAGQASAMSETAYELGTGFGFAVLGSVLAAVYSSRLVIPAGVEPADRATADTLGGALELAGKLPESTAASLADSARAAFHAGVEVTTGIGAAVLLTITVVIAILWREPAPTSPVTPDEG